MLTKTESLSHQIDRLKNESRLLKKCHKWGLWDNWREFTQLDIEIIDLQIDLLMEEKRLLEQALQDYKDY